MRQCAEVRLVATSMAVEAHYGMLVSRVRVVPALVENCCGRAIEALRLGDLE